MAPFIRPVKSKAEARPQRPGSSCSAVPAASGCFVLLPSTLPYFKSTSDASALRATRGSESITSTFSCSYFLIYLLGFKLISALCGETLEVLFTICPLKPFTWLPPKPYEERTTQSGHELFRGWDSIKCFLVQTLLCVSDAELWLIAGPRVGGRFQGASSVARSTPAFGCQLCVTVQTSASLPAALALGHLAASGLRLENIRVAFLCVLSLWKTSPTNLSAAESL